MVIEIENGRDERVASSLDVCDASVAELAVLECLANSPALNSAGRRGGWLVARCLGQSRDRSHPARNHHRSGRARIHGSAVTRRRRVTRRPVVEDAAARGRFLD